MFPIVNFEHIIAGWEQVLWKYYQKIIGNLAIIRSVALSYK